MTRFRRCTFCGTRPHVFGMYLILNAALAQLAPNLKREQPVVAIRIYEVPRRSPPLLNGYLGS